MKTTTAAASFHPCLWPRPGAILIPALLAMALAGSAGATTFSVPSGEVAIDANGVCSLAEAIDNANFDMQVDNDDCPVGSVDDTIELATEATYTLQEALPPFLSQITVEGHGAVIERDPLLSCNLDGVLDAGEFRLVRVQGQESGPATLVLHNLTLRNGCIDDSADNDGGCVSVAGAMLILDRVAVKGCQSGDKSGGVDADGGAVTMILDSTISGNTSLDGGGGVGNGDQCTITIERSTISGNSSGGSGGGGVGNDGFARIVSSTISENSTNGLGGGGIGNSAILELVSSTVWKNSATAGLGGGGIGNAGTISIKNSIVGGSLAGGDCMNVGPSLSGEGKSFETDGSCAALDPDFLEVTAGDLALGNLAANGGPTATQALGAASVAIDAASDCTLLDGTTMIAEDQRGVARPLDGNGDTIAVCDVGAFEREPSLFEDGFESGDTSAWSSASP